MARTVRFVGREGELSRLLGALGGGARLVLVVGDAGAGKTRFVAEAMARAGAAELLAAVAARAGPGVGLVVEDVHWADSETLDFLTFLVRAGRRGRCGWWRRAGAMRRRWQSM